MSRQKTSATDSKALEDLQQRSDIEALRIAIEGAFSGRLVLAIIRLPAPGSVWGWLHPTRDSNDFDCDPLESLPPEIQDCIQKCRTMPILEDQSEKIKKLFASRNRDAAGQATGFGVIIPVLNENEAHAALGVLVSAKPNDQIETPVREYVQKLCELHLCCNLDADKKDQLRERVAELRRPVADFFAPDSALTDDVASVNTDFILNGLQCGYASTPEESIRNLCAEGVRERQTLRPRGSLVNAASERSQKVEGALIGYLSEQHAPSVGCQLVLALGEWGGPAVVEMIEKQIEDASRELTLCCLTAARTVGGERAVEFLMSFAADSAAAIRVRDEALFGLEELISSTQTLRPDQMTGLTKSLRGIQAATESPQLIVERVEKMINSVSTIDSMAAPN